LSASDVVVAETRLELCLKACSTIEVLELQVEERLRRAVT